MSENKLLEELADIVSEDIELAAEEKAIKDRRAALRARGVEILEVFDNITQEVKGHKVMASPAHYQNTFDGTRFKADHPKLYKEYRKEVAYKATIIIK